MATYRRRQPTKPILQRPRDQPKATNASELLDSAEVLKIDGTSLSPISETTLRRLAVVECTQPNQMEQNRILAYDPRDGTVDDPRLGPLERDTACQTCHQDIVSCPGHLGYITLAVPFVNPLFAHIVVSLLNTFCGGCGRARFSPVDLVGFRDLSPTERLRALSDLSLTKKPQDLPPGHEKCPLAPRYIARLTAQGMATFAQDLAEMDLRTRVSDYSGSVFKFEPEEKGHPKPVSSQEIRTLLERIRPDDLSRIGVTQPSEPEWVPSVDWLNFSEAQRQADETTTRAKRLNELAQAAAGTRRETNLKAQYAEVEAEARRLRHLVDQGFRIIPDFDPHLEISSFIVTLVPVLPPCSRPFDVIEGERVPNELTKAYSDLIVYNNKLREVGLRSPEAQHYITNLYRVYEGVMTALKLKIKGKDGLIRGVIMGKRVDFSGRSVLTPYNTLAFGEVAYPAVMKRVHTKPFTVTPDNREALLELYRAGKICRMKICQRASRFYDSYVVVDPKFQAQYEPQVGDIVEREGQDGDETLFNRQPTLHKQSMMGYRARYIEDSEGGKFLCIGLHSSYTTPHNADFDGDEGNKHKLQTLGAQSEARHIADVGSCLMSAQDSRPMIGLVYNTLTAAYLMTFEDIAYPETWFTEACGYLIETTHALSLRRRLPAVTGKLLFSLLLPPDLTYTKKPVRIVRGLVVDGPIGKGHIGPSSNSLIQVIWKQYGKERTIRFLTEGQWLLDWFLEKRGFGIGIRHCLAGNRASMIESIIAVELEKSQALIKGLGPLPPEAGAVEADFHEAQIRSFLNTTTAVGQKIGAEALAADNPLNVMRASGAKGNETNTAQIVGCIGQVYVAGERPKRGMTEGTRGLPYFEPNSEDITARGFVAESFMTGMRPASFVFHMMASRVNLVDMATKTADIGHMHRRMVKALEDICVRYDGSVRDMRGNIKAYSYTDGFNSAELVPTETASLGKVTSFVNVQALADQLNTEI